ncbi:glycosyltransferase family 2 protein [Mucilaginibacter ximonensis]|uniref:Glycosyltransferase family 2 protein n=1 Tax=Mucilaginibacter ximonensis TaxID=538021 RepID=A0ABW5YDN0_9SPHI
MKVSVIIPCYNDGVFLKEAVDSVLACNYNDLELIIVNDGSDDATTLDILAAYEQKGFNVITHANQGLGYTRNQGVKQARGHYILPLDADNKIRKGYLDKAIALLDNNVCDIVYARPFFFGEDIPTRKFITHEFDGDALFVGNYIDACAIYRKAVWEAVGGYDENMPVQGAEDWEFWLHCHLKNFRFKFLNEELYEYRVSGNSMITKISEEKKSETWNFIMIKHVSSYRTQFLKLNTYKQFFINDQRNYLRTTAKYFAKWLKIR